MTAGTDSRVGRWVRGRCQACGEEDALLYEAAGSLVCAADYRTWAAAHPTSQACDVCGDTGNVWRDPLTRKNEYLCIKHHDPDALFQNRWANKVRQSEKLGVRARAVCEFAGYGTECKGEVKPRGQFQGRLSCNKHAGKQGVGPNG